MTPRRHACEHPLEGDLGSEFSGSIAKAQVDGDAVDRVFPYIVT
jgi:hypothetical protein